MGITMKLPVGTHTTRVDDATIGTPDDDDTCFADGDESCTVDDDDGSADVYTPTVSPSVQCPSVEAVLPRSVFESFSAALSVPCDKLDLHSTVHTSSRVLA